MTKSEAITLLKTFKGRSRLSKIISSAELINLLTIEFPDENVNILSKAFCLQHNTSPYCSVCHTILSNLSNNTCSYKCREILNKPNTYIRLQKQKVTLQQKYSVDNISQIPGGQDKRINTMIEKYGAKVSPKAHKNMLKNGSRLNDIGRKSLFEKYGVDNPGQIPGHADRCKQTSINKLGVDHYTKTKEFQDALDVKRTQRWSSFVPNTIRFISLNSASYNKQHLYDNPNKVIAYECMICGRMDSSPTETIKWRIQNTGTCCTICSGVGTGSLAQNEINNFIISLGINTILNDRVILDGEEIDILVPEKNIGFEYDGLFWHNELRKPKDYHINKTIKASNKGIRLIHIFEDEWIHSPEIVKSRIKYLLNVITSKIPARKCKIQEVGVDTEKEFLSNNHLQGYARSKVKLGLYYDGILVSLMTFSSLSRSKGYKKIEGSWELLRFCNVRDTTVVGGANRLFTHFIRTYNPKKILSFADKRWSVGELYHTLNFEYTGDTNINYWYVDGSEGKRLHRFGMRKNSTDDQTLTEYENRLNQGFVRIWDCGSARFIWSDNQTESGI